MFNQVAVNRSPHLHRVEALARQHGEHGHGVEGGQVAHRGVHGWRVLLACAGPSDDKRRHTLHGRASNAICYRSRGNV
jgi:hypothetical protein